jgi:hypothetical protein
MSRDKMLALIERTWYTCIAPWQECRGAKTTWVAYVTDPFGASIQRTLLLAQTWLRALGPDWLPYPPSDLEAQGVLYLAR